MGWLTGYGYRKSVTITGSSGAGEGYQVDFSIAETAGGDFTVPSSEAFPNDLRFTDNDQTSELSYWIEDLTLDPIKCWIKITDDLGSNVDIYCYYGKSGDSTASNGDNVFASFFDDFSGYTTSDPEELGKWTKDTTYGTAVIDTEANTLVLDSDTQYQGPFVDSTATFSIPCAFEFRVKNHKTASGDLQCYLRKAGESSLGLRAGINYGVDNAHYYKATNVKVSDTDSSWLTCHYYSSGTLSHLIIDEHSVDDERTHASSQDASGRFVRFMANHLEKGEVAYAFIREFIVTEPAFFSAGSEESAPSGFIPYPLLSGMDGGISQCVMGGIAR
jgi:hypothetical protein